MRLSPSACSAFSIRCRTAAGAGAVFRAGSRDQAPFVTPTGAAQYVCSGLPDRPGCSRNSPAWRPRSALPKRAVQASGNKRHSTPPNGRAGSRLRATMRPAYRSPWDQVVSRDFTRADLCGEDVSGGPYRLNQDRVFGLLSIFCRKRLTRMSTLRSNGFADARVKSSSISRDKTRRGRSQNVIKRSNSALVRVTRIHSVVQLRMIGLRRHPSKTAPVRPKVARQGR